MDKEKVIKGLEHCIRESEHIDDNPCDGCPYFVSDQYGCERTQMEKDALALLKEKESLLGIQQTADGITFISTGTAQQGEERGILLGKSLMYEWIYKELLHKGLLTDDIRSVFEQAKRI